MSKLNYNCKNIDVDPSFSEIQYDSSISCFSQMCDSNVLCIQQDEDVNWNSSPYHANSLHNERERTSKHFNVSEVNPQRTFFLSQSSFHSEINIASDERFENIYRSCDVRNDVEVATPVVRTVKRRSTANKKERRRTQSINSAFAYLRDCIPNVPSDTKLSKIKTLRLATSYITYLNRVLEGDQDPSKGFRAELIPSSRKINAERRAKENNSAVRTEIRKIRGRTGWPQHVWASELNSE